ncbi:MAG: DNA polymerase domain-containing protein, partial [Halobacterium sp.]
MEDTDLSEFMHEGGDASDDGDAPDEDVVRAEAEVVAGDADPVVNEIVSAEADALPDVDREVELMVTQVDYTVEGDGDRERPVLHVFGRREDNTAEHVRVHGFRPYFYAPTERLDEDDLTDDVITGYEETDDDGEPYESIRGERLTKIFGRTPRDVGNIRDKFEHYEADILFPNRLLIDKDITSGIRVPERRAEDGAVWVHHDEIETADVDADVRVNTFDIEVDDRSGFPEEGEEPIVCLTSHDSYNDEYIAWLYEAPDATAPAPSEVADHDLLDEDADVEVRGFETEEAMHEAFIEYVEETDPDVLTGWNFDDFDAPYYIDRLDELDPYTDRDLDSDRLSRVNEVWTSGWGGPNVKGRVVFDLLYGYQRMQRSELDSYRLDAVGEKELDVGKERYTGDIGDLWEQDPERLLEYNVRDVELCVEIDRKQNIVPFWKEVAEFVGCKLEDATTPGDAVDLYILHKAHGRFVLPSKGQQESEDYEGGAVFDPITGVRENVTVLDLKSLYPMCMVTTNASPETKVDPEAYDGETYRAPNGTHFRKEPDGIIREIIDETLAEREQKKALRNDHDPESEAYDRYDRQQAAVKVIMNSLYGVLGWERFRLYDKEMGAAVTATGREVISFTEEAANDIGHEVAYG